MNYRDTLLEPIADAVVSSKSSGKPKPNQRPVRGKSVFNNKTNYKFKIWKTQSYNLEHLLNYHVVIIV